MGLREGSTIPGMMRQAAVPLLTGLVYFWLALVTINATQSYAGIAPIWPANALVLAVVLLRPRPQAWAIIAFGMLGNAVAVLATGGGLPEAFLYPAINLAELAIAMLGLKSRDGKRRVLSEPRAVVRVLFWAGLLAPAASASLGALTTWHLFAHPVGSALLRWYLSDALGLLIFTPFFIALLSGEAFRRVRAMGWWQRAEFAGLLALVAVVTWAVFFVARNPLLFLITMPMMLVTFRAGWLGTKLALAIVAIVVGVATMTGNGPIALLVHGADMQTYGVQLYVAALLLIQMPVAATLTARQDVVDKLRESEQALRMLAARSPILLLSFDLQGICERVVGTNSILLDRDAADLVGSSFAEISAEGQFELRCAHNAALEDISQSHAAEFRTVHDNDAWFEAVFRVHFDETERCLGTIATIHDVTQRKNQELSLSRTASTDSLTGLLNRAGFRARLDQALINAASGALSIAVIDVDRFKLINDNSGHQVGDIVLREIARRISGQVRASDAVGRLGGDEFVILLATPNWDTVQEICGRIVAAVGAEPIALPSGGTLRTAISCGVARYRQDLKIDEFIHEADVALYEAKRNGRNRVVAA